MILARQLATAWSLVLLTACGGAGSIAASGIMGRAIAAGADGTGSFPVDSPSGTLPIPFRLMKPAGDGPFPAVVIAHDCSGVGPRSSGAPMRWARKLVPLGYVVMMPDSFTPRGFPDGVCTNNRAQAARPLVRRDDAVAAARYLRTLPYVDGGHIGLMGGSHGGSTTLATLADSRPDKRAGFAAAIALYPNCGVTYGEWRVRRSESPDGPVLSFAGAYRPAVPLLILIGEKDDWTPAPYCEKLADAAQLAGYPVFLKIYPGAVHSFDSNFRLNYNPDRNNVNKPGGRGATTGGDPAAWADAETQVTAFFGKYLKGTD